MSEMHTVRCPINGDEVALSAFSADSNESNA